VVALAERRARCGVADCGLLGEGDAAASARRFAARARMHLAFAAATCLLGQTGGCSPRARSFSPRLLPHSIWELQVKRGAQSWRSCPFFLPCVCAKKTVRSDHACNTHSPLPQASLSTPTVYHCVRLQSKQDNCTALGKKSLQRSRQLSIVCVDSWARWPEVAG